MNKKNLTKKSILMKIIISILLGIILISFLLTLLSYYRRTERVKSLDYDCVVLNEEFYYPTTRSLQWLPVSLPPQGKTKIFLVIDGSIDYSNEYYCQTFIDDYESNWLFYDNIVFEKKKS